LATKTFQEIQNQTRLIVSATNSTDAYTGSQALKDDVQEAYKHTANSHDFPELLLRSGIVKIANLDRYSLPDNYRKARTIRIDGVKYDPVELENLKFTRRGYHIEKIQNDIILRPIPNEASSPFTLADNETAGTAVVVGLDTVSGLTQLDEIWIDSASGTDEFSIVSSIDSSAPSITTRLDSAKSASDVIYRVNQIIDIIYYRHVPVLSGTSDTILLPDDYDFILPHYAAYLALNRLEEYTQADKQLELYNRRSAEAFLANDKTSTGEALIFGIAN